MWLIADDNYNKLGASDECLLIKSDSISQVKIETIYEVEIDREGFRKVHRQSNGERNITHYVVRVKSDGEWYSLGSFKPKSFRGEAQELLKHIYAKIGLSKPDIMDMRFTRDMKTDDTRYVTEVPFIE